MSMVPVQSYVTKTAVTSGRTDPLLYLFEATREENLVKDLPYKKRLKKYVGFYKEGENLKNYCERNSSVVFHDPQSREVILRSFLSTLQYIGLDVTIRALASYGRYFEFTDTEFENLTQRLVLNYCTPNLTVFSKSQLYRFFRQSFASPKFPLPSINKNPYFSDYITKRIDSREGRKQEMVYTTKLFRSFCSWNGDVNDLRLLVPLVQDPYIMSYLIRHLTMKKIAYDPVDNKIFLDERDEKKSVQVACDNLICRRTTPSEFDKRTPYSIGAKNREEDAKRIYCAVFKKMDFSYNNQEKHVKKWMNNESLSDLIFHRSQFVSLLTSIPDFFIRLPQFEGAISFLESTIDSHWDRWARLANNNNSRDIFYEESVTVETVDFLKHYNPVRPRIRIVFDVNAGEMDKTHQFIDKIGVKMSVRVAKSFLLWAKKRWVDIDPSKKETVDGLLAQFKGQITHQIKKSRQLFVIPPWKGELEELVVVDILKQVQFFSKEKLNELYSDGAYYEFPIEFRYGPFALQYIQYRFRSERGLPEISF